MRRLGPYSRPPALTNIDGRSKEARLLRQMRAELTAHVGGNPSATERAVIERVAILALHMAAIDRKAMEGGTLTELDSRTYLAWSNAFTRTITRLGPARSGAPAPAGSPLQNYMAAKAGAK